MLNCLRNCISVFLGILGVFIINAQELPPIEYYSPEIYSAESQNWDISQKENKFIYVANNRGILEFNGSIWKLLPSPNKTIIRSVKAIGDKVYIGCYMELGYWSIINNKFTYTSLLDKIGQEIIEDEQFWQIDQLDNWVVFRSLNRIYLYNLESDNFKVIDSSSIILKMFKIGKEIYFQNTNEGLFKFENGIAQLVLTNNQLINFKIIDIFKRRGDTFYVTENNGIHILKDNQLKPWGIVLNDQLKEYSVYCATQLSNGSIALGTVGHGLLIINTDAVIELKIDQRTGLGNNTVLSIFEDQNQNLWLGLDNGINVINMSSPYRIYNDSEGQIGTVYTSLIKNDILYLGTNQGLFYKKFDTSSSLKLVEETNGQVWFLKEIEGKVFCGHNLGSFVIEGETAIKISDEMGAWDIQEIPNQTHSYLLGTYSGLYPVKFYNGKWTIEDKIKDFNISSRDFEIIGQSIFVNHEYKGIFHIQMNDSFSDIRKISKLNYPEKGIHSGLIKYKDDLLYSSSEGIFKYILEDDKFKFDTNYSKLYSKENYSSGKLVKDKLSNRLWSFSDDALSYISTTSLEDKPVIIEIPIHNSFRKGKIGFENILNLGENKYLYGTSQGYIIFDEDELLERDYDLIVQDIFLYKNNEDKIKISPSDLSDLNNSQNTLEFNYTVAEYDKYLKTYYRYKLEDDQNLWTAWTETPSVTFKNLDFGDYKFMLQAKVGNQIIEKSSSIEFSIAKPWYLSNLMVIIYLISIILFSILMHILYTNYYEKQKQKLLLKNKRVLELKEMEYEKERMQLTNEKLAQDVESKNRELAISTMSLIRKNQFLNEIKKELNNLDKGKAPKRIVDIIDKKINTDDDWEYFETAFNNADKDFLQNIKSKHPNLTNNDLKLCAYLRLNLASKEIAPLLNITYRSVEIKRYRLRKKMGLKHETSLTDYILDL